MFNPLKLMRAPLGPLGATTVLFFALGITAYTQNRKPKNHQYAVIQDINN